MTIAWSTVRPAFKSLFCDLSGIQAVWQNQRRPHVHQKNQAIVTLRIRSDEELGSPETRYRDLGATAPDPTLEEQVVTQHKVSLEVRVESFRQDDDCFAMGTLGRIRTKLRQTSSTDRLRSVGAAIIETGPAIDLPTIKKDQRLMSVATMELMLHIATCTVDDEEDNHVFNIETVDNPRDNPNTQIDPFC